MTTAEDVSTALDAARALVRAGVPLFLAHPAESEPTGFKLPYQWQNTQPDLSVVDRWQPGMALCAVMGCGIDLLDFDPRNGGTPSNLNGVTPTVYAVAGTPSDGYHAFIRSLGERSRDRIKPGVDYKGGNLEGVGRGFAFIAPTVRISKTSGQPASYTWIKPPDLSTLTPADRSGAALAALVHEAHGKGAPSTNGMAPSDFMRVGPWQDVAGTLRDGRNRGVLELAAALRGRGGWRFEDALTFMRTEVWPAIDQTQGGHTFTEAEFERAVRSAFERYPDGAEQRVAEAADTASERIPLHGVGLSDAWMVQRVAHHLTGRFLWTKGLGWLTWDGRRWDAVADAVVKDEVRRYVVYLHSSAAAEGVDSDSLKRLATLLASGRYGTYTTDCRGVEGIYFDAEAFDQHPDLLNCANGIVDLRTGELRPHDPDLRMMKLSPVEYHPDATHPDWDAALTALPAEILEWWQLRMGQGITGHMTPDDVMLVQQGGGENGKTTVMTAIRQALGDYYLAVSHRVLIARAAENHPTELCDFLGARLALLEETPEEGRLNVTRLKAAVGTTTITARKMRRDDITFNATHTLVLNTNYQPVVDETDNGTWRRLALVRFPYRWLPVGQTPRGEHERMGDPNLRQRLQEGLNGQHRAVLTWLVAGARRWYAEDRVMPPPPELVTEDTLEWRKQADLVLAYLDECLVFDPAAHVMSAELSTDLREWLVSRGQQAWSERRIGSRFGGHSELVSRGVTKRKIKLGTPAAEGLSRRPVRPGAMTAQRVVETSYLAWLGLRFSTDTDDNPNQGGDSPRSNPDSENRSTSWYTQTGKRSSSTCKVPVVPGSAVDTRIEKIAKSRLTGEPGTTGTKIEPKIDNDGIQNVTVLTVGDGLPIAVDRGQFGWETPDLRPLTVDDATEQVRSLTAAAGALTVDVESTGYPLGHPDYALRTVQLGNQNTAVVFDAAWHSAAITALLAEAPVLHAHSATADLVPLAHAGLLDIASGWARMEDTAILAALADLGAANDELGLKALSRDVLKDNAVSPVADKARGELFKAGKWLTSTQPTTPITRSGWAQVDSADPVMVRYAASDVLDTAALAGSLPRPALEVLERERAVQRITAVVAHQGLRIDPDQTNRLYEVSTWAKSAAAERIKTAGVDTPGSKQQLATALTELGAQLGRTKPSKTHPDGQPSVAHATLVKLRNQTGPWSELVADVLDYRHHETALGLFLNPYKLLCERGDGRARPTIYTLGADTGRMSCVRPNLQQVPRAGGFRLCLTADEGQLVIAADFSGVELRVAAALSGDQNLAQMLRDGTDIHGEIARQVYGPDATKADRYNTKRLVFGNLYGGGVATLAANQGISESEAAAAIDVLNDMTPVLSQWSARLREVIRHGATEFPTYAGRIIYLPKAYPHKAPNYCIQGTARELLVDALIKWDQGPWGGGVILPIHDEIVAVVPEDSAEDALRYLTECMATELYGVPIVASAGVPSFAWPDAE